MVYAVVSKKGEVVNLIEYDGKAEYDPGEGLSLVKVPANQMVSLGWKYTNKKFVEPES